MNTPTNPYSQRRKKITLCPPPSLPTESLNPCITTQLLKHLRPLSVICSITQHLEQARVASVLKLSSSSPTASLGLLLADAVWRKGGTTSRVSAAAKSWLSVYTPPSHCLYCWPMQWTSWTRTCLEDVPGPNLSLFIIFFFWLLGGAYSIITKKSEAMFMVAQSVTITMSRHSEWGTMGKPWSGQLELTEFS